jgi:Leucine-rich repeat (LRR) protein
LSNFELPKLPQLSEDDVKAVRGFLPGKLLGRTAAILSLVLLVLGFSGAVGKGLQYVFNIDLPWWGYAILLALALLAVVAQVLSEWLSERNRQAKQKLAIQTGAAQTGYFRIGPYQDTEIDRARFSRPDRAEEKALDWIRKSGQLPLYFTGDSGSGKSSLLNASLLPKLRTEGWTVVEARAWQDPLGAIGDALQKLFSARRWKAPDEQTLAEMIKQAARRDSGKLLIVLDQFEEFLILASPERQREFAAFAAEMQASPAKKPWLLLVLRSDYQTFLEEAGLPPLRAGENLFQLGRFQFAAAAEFMKKSGLDLQPEALQTLLTSAAVLDDTPGLVRPITPNVTGYILASGAPVARSLDAGTLVRTYIEQTMQQSGLRDGGPQLLEQMITEQGTKQPRSEKDLAEKAKLRPAEVRAIMNGLSDAGLARPLDAGQGVWELSHDFIAHAVARFLGRWRGDLRRYALAYAAPALFAMTLAVGVGAAIWEQSSAARLRVELADLGVTTSLNPQGIHADLGGGITNEELFVIGPKLVRLPNVSSLTFPGTARGANLEPLKGLIALQTLDLYDTQVANLEPLKGLTALQKLKLYDTQVADLEPLKGLAALQELYLSSTQAANLEPLKGLTGLQWLVLDNTRVGNLEPLKGLTALQWLFLDGTQVANLEPLKGLTALQTLDLTGTPVKNLEPIYDLPNLIILEVDEPLKAQFVQYREQKGLPY